LKQLAKMTAQTVLRRRCKQFFTVVKEGRKEHDGIDGIDHLDLDCSIRFKSISRTKNDVSRV
tara:strand:- start:365 stop:550 length:186 start_codon:yes stop_codon:yes gene_type:complete